MTVEDLNSDDNQLLNRPVEHDVALVLTAFD
jgi:hypothetical protein